MSPNRKSGVFRSENIRGARATFTRVTGRSPLAQPAPRPVLKSCEMLRSQPESEQAPEVESARDEWRAADSRALAAGVAAGVIADSRALGAGVATGVATGVSP